jgi:cytochrome c5
MRLIKTLTALLAATTLAGCGGSGEGATATATAPAGETTYQRFCFSCHAAGVAGAPRTGDAAAWAPRIAKGEDALLASTVNGLPPGMPPKGLCAQCSEADLLDAVRYMVERSR